MLTSSLAFASERRNLTEIEEERLKKIAIEHAGIDVWYIEGLATEVEGGVAAFATVVFQPAVMSEHCLAPTGLFRADGSEPELHNWDLFEGGSFKYRFWFETCMNADPQSPIELDQYVDISVLERLRIEQEQIVRDAIDRFSSDRQYIVPVRGHKLRSISISFDRDYGAIYRLRYWGTSCRGLSVHTALEPNEISVIESWEWVC